MHSFLQAGGDKAVSETCKHLLRGAPDCVFCHRDQLKQELSLAEEGLANYAQEVEQLKAALSKYGFHTCKCSAGFPISDHCTCGFSDALRKFVLHPNGEQT